MSIRPKSSVKPPSGPRNLLLRPAGAALLLATLSMAACERACAQPRDVTPPPPAPTTSTSALGNAAPPTSSSADDKALVLAPWFPHSRRDGGAGPIHRKPRRKAGPPRPGWPLIVGCDTTPCITGAGEPGFRYTTATSYTGKACRPQGTCFNPCPVGMASTELARTCNFMCRTDEDCAAGECLEGLCETLFAEVPVPGSAADGSSCQLKDGRFGIFDPSTGLCGPMCKLGLEPYGGTDCMKPCHSKTQCPGGPCIVENPGGAGYCGDSCPELGCPYPWE
jgi:hypothetical protein